MKRFTLYTQRGTLDCGPTCLRMIAAFYGKKLSMECIHQLCVYSQNGTTMLSLKKAAEVIGFKTLGVKVNLLTLAENIPLPCILYWRQEHFVVLYEVRKKRGHIYYYVADPVGSRFKYSEREMEKCWEIDENTGVVLCLEPTEELNDFVEKKQKQKNVLNFLWTYIQPYKYVMLNILLGMFLGTIFMLFVPFLTQAIIDFGVKDKNVYIVWIILLGQFLLVFGTTFVELVRNRILLYIGVRVDILMISDFILKLTKLPISFFDIKMSGDIMQRISDHQRIKEFLTGTSLTMLFSLINLLIFSGVFLYYNVMVFLIFTVCSTLYIGWVWLFMKKRATIDNRMFSLNSLSQNNVFEIIFGMQDMKLNGCENDKRWDWEKTQVSIYKVLSEGLKLSQYQLSGGVMLNQVKNICVTAFVATRVIDGTMTLGMMLALQFLMGMLNSPLEQLVTFVKKLQDAKLSMGRLNEIYNLKDECEGEKVAKIPHDSINVHHISFKYDKLAEEAVLKDVDFEIKKGKSTAIVGLSGSGKTTLLKLLLGFYTPDSGTITIGGISLLDYDIREWRKKCGVVMQDGFVYSDTIARNIVPSGEIDKKRLILAARMANVLSFVETMPLGFHTKIGGEGKGLSSGQKQRLLIARAIYKNPDYLFLDEATNSLDANNEKEVMGNLKSFLQGRTSVIIAHRLSTVKDADHIVVMKSGHVVEQGTHQTLLDKKGVYYSLIKNQLAL